MTINQDDTRSKQRFVVLGSGFFLLFITMFFSISAGAVHVSFPEITSVLLGTMDGEAYRIIYLLRLPRTIVAGLVGANLALAGCILQGVLRNPLADPGIIGVSSGAGLFAMLLMVLVPEQTILVPVAAFLGAVLATGIVFLLSWERGINPLRMILAGVAVAAFFGGGMSALMIFFPDRIQGTVAWMAGGFQGRSWNHVRMLLPYSVLGTVGTMLFYKQLNALQLGDEVAVGVGISVKRTRVILIVASALLAAAAVSVAGLLGFVGLIVPHIVRLLVGSDHEYLLPCTAVYGAILVMGADTVARTVFNPLEIPVGIFMAFLGAPFFLYLLRKGKHK